MKAVTSTYGGLSFWERRVKWIPYFAGMDARMIAHDMRMPLNALVFSLQAVKSAKDGDSRDRALKLAERNTKALSDIIDALLELGSAGRGQLVLKGWLPLDLVTGAIDQIAPGLTERGVRVEIGELVTLPPIMADGNRVVRVLVNLLSNAVRFSPMGGLIRIDARPRLNDGHQVVVFSVADEGPGVPPEKIDQIFVKGVSLGPEEKSSTGLGLTVCRELVEAHGGRIWVETGREKGATFAFSIPADLPV